MDKLRIRGGHRLHGEVAISGAKNAALPELCAAILSADPVTLLNVPRLQDVSTMVKLIRHMGVSAERNEAGDMVLNASALHNPEAPYELVKTMRASVLVGASRKIRSMPWARRVAANSSHSSGG